MDGTLLNTEGKLSKNSFNILQPLINNGLSFVAATGRTRDNALGAIKPLTLRLPLICDNGTLIYDTINREFLSQKTISASNVKKAIDLILGHRISPFINTLDGDFISVYYGKPSNLAQKSYYEIRSAYGLSGYFRDDSYTEFMEKAVFNFSMLDTLEKLAGLYEKFKSDKNFTTLMFPAEYYDGHYWLEILPANSGKGQAVDFLLEKYKPKKVVCFGDNLNDLCMFERADVKIAPSNAVNEVKEAADIVIGHCDDDSVAKYIENEFKSL